MTKNFKIKVELGVNVTQEDIDDIVTAALEGGINYWCKKAEVVEEYLGEFASEQISRGGTLKLYDGESDEVYELNAEKLLSGIKKYCEGKERPYAILYSETNLAGLHTGAYGLDCCMVDGTVADMIIQYAIFGEIVYG